MRRLLLLCVAAFSTVALLFAKSRTTNLTRADVIPVLIASSRQLFGNADTRVEEAEEAFYIFNAGQQRFVIVSADDQMKPILGYSDKGPFITESIPGQIA